jgi:hypothetical protein
LTDKITHFELCRVTANRFLKESDVVLFEYQNTATGEFPDVLCFNGAYSKLFEIKVDYQDFRKDNQKDCRRRLRIKYLPQLHVSYDYENYKERKQYIKYRKDLTEYIEQCPHLGRQRYYVCPAGLIQPEEIKNGFGLYWYNGKFSLKKKSERFRHDMFAEMNILLHAFRKYGNNHQENILIRKYMRNY